MSATTGEELPDSPWLTVGREYVVLEITAYPEREVLFRLLGDDDQGGPGVWESRLFTTVSAELSASWTAAVDDHGVLTLGPEVWRRVGFWEAYFDGDADAIHEFNDALERLLAR